MASAPQTSSKPMMENKNVAGGQLALFSNAPKVGFYRDGYCRTGPDDKGNHAVAATVTQDFLDFSASKGNNLKDVGVKAGMKWCLCVSRWKEAFDAVQKGDLSQEAVPKVHLHASHESALQGVSYSDLRKFAAAGEAPSGGRTRQDIHHSPESQGGIAKETNELGGDFSTTAPSEANRE